ncbi:hypothetical protein [Azospirillum sp. SYSU D00513]|uniref:hypothetical protein n=1 Tax=Azospirillum sp. SYSU D00513 TaxID=2812561 RepID=UPI001A9771F9|nr:hypothetical protein [Azospirillum sp. SYSU D00513]
MIPSTTVNWTTLTTLRAIPGPGITTLPASVIAITRAANLKPLIVRPALDELVKLGYVREYQTRYGKEYARTPQGDRRLSEVKEWLR